MPNGAIVGAGAVLQLSIASVFTTITDITGLAGPEQSVGDIDVTNLLSPNVFKEYLPGWGEGGVVTIEGNYNHTQAAILYGTIRASQNWKMIFSDATYWTFTGYINAFSMDNPLTEQVTNPFSIKVTGKPVFSG